MRTIRRVDISTLPAATLQRLKAACYTRDVADIFRILQGCGWSQRAIAAATGQSQSEISEILGGRRVVSYDVHTRIFDGLDLPRGWGGLEYGPDVTPPEPTTISGNGHADATIADDGIRWAVLPPVPPPAPPAPDGAVRPGAAQPRHRGRSRRNRRRGR